MVAGLGFIGFIGLIGFRLEATESLGANKKLTTCSGIHGGVQVQVQAGYTYPEHLSVLGTVLWDSKMWHSRAGIGWKLICDRSLGMILFGTPEPEYSGRGNRSQILN